MGEFVDGEMARRLKPGKHLSEKPEEIKSTRDMGKEQGRTSSRITGIKSTGFKIVTNSVKWYKWSL